MQNAIEKTTITITKRKKHKKIINKPTKTKKYFLSPPEKCWTECVLRVKVNLIAVRLYFVVFTAPI